MAPRSTPTGPGSGPAIAGPLIGALEDAWAAIRARHPDVAPAVIITGSGSGSGRHMLRLGHYAASRWQPGADGDELDEIFIGGEGLARGAGPVLATLLHEAAHAVARARGIQDTSRQGRYHNQRFKRLGEELGLQIDKHPALGWSTTTLPASTARRYATTIRRLEHAITIYRRHELGAGARPGKSPAPPCVCACGRRIRVAPGVLALGPILCSLCEQPFEPLPGPDAPAPAALSQLCTPTVAPDTPTGRDAPGA